MVPILAAFEQVIFRVLGGFQFLCEFRTDKIVDWLGRFLLLRVLGGLIFYRFFRVVSFFASFGSSVCDFMGCCNNFSSIG